jgi:hypothetical protein
MYYSKGVEFAVESCLAPPVLTCLWSRSPRSVPPSLIFGVVERLSPLIRGRAMWWEFG